MVSSSDEDRLFYLLSGSCEVLPSSYIKLRSYLNIHSAKLAGRQNLNIFKNRQTSCPYCYSTWTCDTSSFKLLPSKKSIAKKSEKRVNVEPGQKEAMNESRNILVLKCKVCTKKSSFSLVKKQKVQKKDSEEENVKLVRKKKKKKDRSCGLLGVLVNSEKTIVPSPQLLASKKKGGLTSAKNDHFKTPPQKNSPKPQAKSSVNLPNSNCKLNPLSQTSKKLVVNPFSQAHDKLMQKKKQQKLKKLQRAAKKKKNVPKKTLQDFLTLI